MAKEAKQDGATPAVDDSQKLETQIADKVKAGLTRDQAIEVIKAQAENDAQK